MEGRVAPPPAAALLGWELVSVLPGPTGEQHVAYLKRPK